MGHVRGYQSVELVTASQLQLPIQGTEADWLRSIRYGEVPVDDWWDRLLALDAQLESMADDDAISPGPDRARIEQWSVAAHQTVWASLL